MAKPIFIVRLPISFPNEQADNVRETVGRNLGDEYHVLVLKDMRRKGHKIEFECYNAEHNDIEWNILEERINSIIKPKIEP